MRTSSKSTQMQALPALVDDDLVLWESNSLLQYAEVHMELAFIQLI